MFYGNYKTNMNCMHLNIIDNILINYIENYITYYTSINGFRYFYANLRII